MRRVRLTEGNLRHLVENTTRRVLREYFNDGLTPEWARSTDREDDAYEYDLQHSGEFEDLETSIDAGDSKSLMDIFVNELGIPENYAEQIIVTFTGNCNVQDGKVVSVYIPDGYEKFVSFEVTAPGNIKRQIEQKLSSCNLAYVCENLSSDLDESFPNMSWIQNDFEDQFPDAVVDDGPYD